MFPPDLPHRIHRRRSSWFPSDLSTNDRRATKNRQFSLFATIAQLVFRKKVHFPWRILNHCDRPYLIECFLRATISFSAGQDTMTERQKHRRKTLPKAQRTRGLSSYHKITVRSSQILNILQFQNLD